MSGYIGLKHQGCSFLKRSAKLRATAQCLPVLSLCHKASPERKGLQILHSCPFYPGIRPGISSDSAPKSAQPLPERGCCWDNDALRRDTLWTIRSTGDHRICTKGFCHSGGCSSLTRVIPVKFPCCWTLWRSGACRQLQGSPLTVWLTHRLFTGK